MATKKIRFGRLFFALTAILTVIIGIMAALWLLFGQEESVLQYASISLDSGCDYVVNDNYLTYAKGGKLVQVNLANDYIMTSNFEYDVDGYSVSKSMTACYSGSYFFMRGYDNTLTLTGTIRSISSGYTYCAVLKTNAQGQDSIAIFNASGENVSDSISFSDSKVVSFGFDTDNGRETLWVICVNTEASIPSTTVRLYDFNNGGAMSYYPVFYDQTVEKLAFTEDSVFIIGTQDIIRYARSGSREQYRVSIYGKKVIDFRASDGYMYFLMQPRSEASRHTVHLLALAEADSPTETSMTVYCGENIANAFLQTGGIRIVTPTRYISYSYSGKKTRDVELEHTADSVVKLDNSRFLLTSGDDCYFVTINA